MRQVLETLIQMLQFLCYGYRQFGNGLHVDALAQAIAQAHCVVARTFQQTGYGSVFDQCPRGERQVQVACVFFFQQGQVQLEIGVG